jgi:hypothetical protein
MPLTTYYRDKKKVFRAIPGVKYDPEGIHSLVFVSKSVYIPSGLAENNPVSFVFERVKT